MEYPAFLNLSKKPFMKFLIGLAATLIFVALCLVIVEKKFPGTLAFAKNKVVGTKGTTDKMTFEAKNISFKKMIPVLKNDISKNGFNNRYCFIANMAIHSGKPRFFVYNIEKDSIETSGLVTHGYGNNNGQMEFSNISGSNCTSLGKYKIGHAYTGRFGLAYKLYGLDQSNSNAYNRFVVLHAHECVPDVPCYPLSICRSQGCPTVSPAFLKTLARYIDTSSKPIMLKIINQQ